MNTRSQVPAVYTLHTRFLVQNPSGLSLEVAAVIFAVGLAGVALNYAADRERDVFRASGGTSLVWGRPARIIRAEYKTVDRKTGAKATKTSLLLASGFWGVARHFQYFFELGAWERRRTLALHVSSPINSGACPRAVAAWSWCLLANPLVNGTLPLSYAVFLTALLIDRAKRDENKCRLKYGRFYDEYCALVPYKILPGLY